MKSYELWLISVDGKWLATEIILAFHELSVLSLLVLKVWKVWSLSRDQSEKIVSLYLTWTCWFMSLISSCSTWRADKTHEGFFCLFVCLSAHHWHPRNPTFGSSQELFMHFPNLKLHFKLIIPPFTGLFETLSLMFACRAVGPQKHTCITLRVQAWGTYAIKYKHLIAEVTQTVASGLLHLDPHLLPSLHQCVAATHCQVKVTKTKMQTKNQRNLNCICLYWMNLLYKWYLNIVSK